MIIRNEKQEDYRAVEEMIKETFWNLSVPGCNEHYFAHQVRKSEDFIPEQDLVLEEDVYPVALMVKVLKDNALSDKCWKYVESPAHMLDESGFEEFDSTFPQMEKGYKYTQELFYIYSRSNVLR